MDHGTIYQRPEKSIESNAINHDDKLPYFVPSAAREPAQRSRRECPAHKSPLYSYLYLKSLIHTFSMKLVWNLPSCCVICPQILFSCATSRAIVNPRNPFDLLRLHRSIKEISTLQNRRSAWNVPSDDKVHHIALYGTLCIRDVKTQLSKRTSSETAVMFSTLPDPAGLCSGPLKMHTLKSAIVVCPSIPIMFRLRYFIP